MVALHFCLSGHVALLIGLTACLATAQKVTFENCDVNEYYASLSEKEPGDWTRGELESLVTATHRKFLPYTNRRRDDVWKALSDVDPGNLARRASVDLIYSAHDIPSLPHGTPTTWNREHLWPSSRGVKKNGPDFTDIHHLRPADWNLNSVRGNRYFGNCVDRSCVSPAHREAANSTAKNSDIFTPPRAVRGDIARALFYMALRYNGRDGGDKLVLTDCPTAKNEMAYLSVLLQWHREDPVSPAEIRRNQRVCERWQGNRNPFVDYDIAELVYGLPQKAPFRCSSRSRSA